MLPFMLQSGFVISILSWLGIQDEERRRSSSSSYRNGELLNQNETRLLLTGAVLGFGVTFLCNTLMNHFRIQERTRLLWRYCWNTDEKLELFPYRKPTSIQQIQQQEQKNNDTDTSTKNMMIARNAAEYPEDGSIRFLVTPFTCTSHHLHVSIVTIMMGREIPSRYVPAVEFYYVLSAPQHHSTTGISNSTSCSSTCSRFSQSGIHETQTLHVNDCFVVDVGSMCWISNCHGTVPLVLLRVTDGGLQYNKNTKITDRIRLDPTLQKQQQNNKKQQQTLTGFLTRVTTMERFLDGCRQVQNMMTRS